MDDATQSKAQRKPRAKRKRRAAAPESFDVLRQRFRGERFILFLCRNCTRGWRFRDPVDAWKLKNLLKHQAGHVNGMVTQAAESAQAEALKSALH